MASEKIENAISILEAGGGAMIVFNAEQQSVLSDLRNICDAEFLLYDFSWSGADAVDR